MGSAERRRRIERTSPFPFRDAGAAFFISLLAVLVYANSAGNAFALDDRWLIVRNPLIRELGNLPLLFASNYYAPNMKVGLYRPVTTASFAINYGLGGLDPWGYHLVNIALHALNSALVFVLFRALGVALLVATLGGLLFAAHAVHTEAVANVAGRPELLAAFFCLVALCCHVALRQRGARWRRALYAASLVSFGLALLSKENAVTLLGVIVLYDALFVPPSRGSLWARVQRTVGRDGRGLYVGHLLVTLAYLGLRGFSLREGVMAPPTPGIDNPLTLLPFPWCTLNALQVAWRYVGSLLLPLHLSYDYSYAQIPLFRSLADPRLWIVLALSTAALGAAFWSFRRSPHLFFALGFYAITFSIVSNLFIRIGTIMGERLLYLPSVGFCLATAWLLGRAVELRRPAGTTWRGLVLGLALMLIAAHGGRSVVRNGDWSSKERLYLHDVEVSSGSAKALNNAGWILIDRGIDVERGVALVERALQIWPDEAEWLDSLGWGYYKLGRLGEARQLLQRSLELAGGGPTLAEREAHLQAIEAALRRHTTE